MTIDKRQAHTIVHHIGIGAFWTPLPCSGWLIAVTIELDMRKLPQEFDLDTPMRYQIKDSNAFPIYDFAVNHQWGCMTGGIVFDEPLPNLNVARSYTIESISASPAITMYTLGCWSGG